MKKQFVPYELAVKLKELGFDEPCMSTISNIEAIHIKGTRRLPSGAMCTEEVNAPLWQQAFDWFRDKHSLLGNVHANASGYLFEIHHSANKGGSHQHDSGFDGPNDSGCWDEFYEARHACLAKLIELITKKD